MSTEKVEQVFQVSETARLVVKNIRGAVVIVPGQEQVIQVSAVKHTERGNAARTEVEISQADDGTVHAVVHFPDGSTDWLFGRQPCPVDFTIQVPPHCELNISGVSNDLTAGGCTGKAAFRSVSGDMDLHDLQGELRMTTVSGSINARQLAGNIELETVSGDARLENCQLTAIKGKTVSGNTQIQTSLLQGPYAFTSVSGNVTLTIPPETQCIAELHSVSGGLYSALPASASARHGGHQSLVIQGGGVPVSLHGVSADLHLDCDGIPPAPTAWQERQATSRREILTRLENGEMTVDEALEKLHA